MDDKPNNNKNKFAVNPQTIAKKKPRGKPFAGKNDPRNNLIGAPKRGESWAEIIKRIGNMTPAEAADHASEIAKQLRKIGGGITLKEAVVVRVYAALLFEPNASLLNAFMERAEGKVVSPIDLSNTDGTLTWKKIIENANSETDTK